MSSPAVLYARLSNRAAALAAALAREGRADLALTWRAHARFLRGRSRYHAAPPERSFA